MPGLVLSILIACGLWFFPAAITIDPALLSIAAVAISLLFLALFGFSMIFAFTPLQKVEQNLTPRILELLRGDRRFQFIWIWVVFFTISSIFIAASLNRTIPLILWIIGLGITFDLYNHYVRRILGYLNPYVIIQLFTQRAKASVQKEDEGDLCNYIDALTEVGMKSLRRSSTSLCQNAVDELQQITKIYLSSEKSISHHDTEQVSFILFYIFQRLEMINSRADEMKLEPIASGLVSAMGKIAIHAAKYDLSLVSFPLYFLGKFALAAQEQKLSEVGVRATLVLLEVAKEIVDKVDLSYAELRDPFFTLIGQLEAITKEMFRQDKKINFRILNQPFLDLKELFSNAKVAAHLDTPSIQADLDRVLDEFAQLEVVMKTVPPIPKPQESRT